MDTIEHSSKGSVLRPLRTLAFFGRRPVTVSLEPRPASANYRGFHLNDWELCIGCSTCQKVCDNAAISMVRIPDLPADPVAGVRNERPAIDYGRCCWCGLCVDICPTGSLSLSREYVHTCTEAELDSYFVLPDPKGIHEQRFPKGWDKQTDSDLVDLEREPMAERAVEERLDNFQEIVAGFDPQHALLEASRCVQCGMCHDACPTHMDAPEYIRAIWQGDLEEAVRQIYRTNPFAHTCGRVCTHRCESACSVGRRGQPLAIRWLKRYAMDAVPHERVKELVRAGGGPGGLSVAIVGSGPAGLTAAFELARNGHRVVVFEAREQPGGMPRYGIPEYRLPYPRLDEDIDIIQSLGVDIRCNQQVGRDLELASLREQYDAVVLGLGLQLGRSTRIPGSDHAQVIDAVTALRRITEGTFGLVPRRAVVIGGGNVAMDVARSLARLQQHQYGEVQVTAAALEDFDHFLADPEELKEAREEGVVVLDSRGPQECMIDDDGCLIGLRTWKVVSIFDEQGRFAPKFDPSEELIHPGDLVVEAIGQMTDVQLLGEALTERLDWQRGRIQVDDNGYTGQPGLWAAGDMVHGPDVVHAVADGRRVAADIQRRLAQQEAVA